MSDFTDRIEKLLFINNKKRADLIKYTGLKDSTIRQWITRGSVPSAEAAYKVAKYFNVTVEWLITGEGEEHGGNVPELTEEESVLIDIFRKLDDRDKNTILSLAKTLESQYCAGTESEDISG